MTLLSSTMVFLAAAVVAVPLFKRLHLGAILGYLVAGVLIGPSVLHWVGDAETILHFAELGVVLLLFIIGLELEPEKLWRMRTQITVVGGGQLLVSAAIIGVAVRYILGFDWVLCVVIGLAVALSSTAFAIQLMSEQKVLKTPPGQRGFAILLMQDLAVIPILLLVEALAPISTTEGPSWWVSVLALVSVLVIGRFLISPLLRLVSRYGNDENMTAAALLIVIATAMSMQAAGLSMGMGAFVAGMLLANSSFKHQLEAEIEPFKGLLLGLFFIAIGMNLDLSLLASEPFFILSASILLVAIKTTIIFGILRLSGQTATDSMRIGLMLSQGGEFAFVVMTQAGASNLMPPEIGNQVTLIVGMSMALTSPLVILHSMYFNSRNCPAVYDSQREFDEPEVLIAGFGRFGQISARILQANHIPFTALDKDADQIEFVRRFGNKVFYGDACRLDLLKTAGIAHAKIALVAVDDASACLKIVSLIRENFPEVKIIARARNRSSAMQLAKAGAHHQVRETFDSSLAAARTLMEEFGYSSSEAQKMASIFEQHDRELLESAIEQDMDEQSLIERSKRGREELKNLFDSDQQSIS